MKYLLFIYSLCYMTFARCYDALCYEEIWTYLHLNEFCSSTIILYYFGFLLYRYILFARALIIAVALFFALFSEKDAPLYYRDQYLFFLIYSIRRILNINCHMQRILISWYSGASYSFRCLNCHRYKKNGLHDIFHKFIHRMKQDIGRNRTSTQCVLFSLVSYLVCNLLSLFSFKLIAELTPLFSGLWNILYVYVARDTKSNFSLLSSTSCL